jgi:cytochrome b6-f complex iron-sulfur subunit
MKIPVVGSESPACTTCTRRLLLQGIGVAVASSALASACGSGGGDAADAALDAPTCGGTTLCLDVTMAPNTPLAAVNGSVLLGTPVGMVVVVRSSATTAAALSAICTHQGCTVTFQSSGQLLYCPCHGAEFSLSGSVLRSPANKPLRTYPASVAGNIVTVVLG